MTNSGPDQTPYERQAVFNEYQDYYNQMSSSDISKVCKEPPVTEKALRFLLSESDPAVRFRTIDFYHIASECSQIGSKGCRSQLSALIKATELLEVLCINLFRYPWKKEIKSLKTYTGAFVYFVKAVVPPITTQTILAAVGYQPQSDNQYVLTGSVDSEKVIRVGFDLFLARLECEHLLQVMGQSSQAECLVKLRRRAMSSSLTVTEKAVSGMGGMEKQVDEEEEVVEDIKEQVELSNCCTLGPLGPVGTVEDQMSFKSTGRPEGGLPLEASSVPALQSFSSGHRPSSTALNEDRSILEMQQNYPDLAIRQKLIFNKSKRLPAVPSSRQKQQAAGPTGEVRAVGSHLSGPQPCGRDPLPRLPPQEDSESREDQMAYERQSEMDTEAEPEARGEPEAGDEAGPEAGQEEEEEGVRQLAERMSQLYVCEENLRYPIEETRSHNVYKEDLALPILCHPSSVPVCRIPGCNSCGGGRDAIREPPHSVYIPVCPQELCHPSQDQRQATEGLREQEKFQALEGTSMELQSPAEVGIRGQQQHGNDSPSVKPQSYAVINPRVQQLQSLEGLSEELQSSAAMDPRVQQQAIKGTCVELQSHAVVGPKVQSHQSLEGPSVELQSHAMVCPKMQQHRSSTGKPEDDLLQTYVMVEHDRK